MISHSKIFKLMFPHGCFNREESIHCFEHSLTVAKAARIIADRIGDIDSEKAFVLGLMHDIGKLHLPIEQKYKHPVVGYKMLIDMYPEIADVCISHPFPQLASDSEYIKYYFRNDKYIINIANNILFGIRGNIYTKLIQLCDKISGRGIFVSIDEKFEWYSQKYKVSEPFVRRNYDAYHGIKKELDEKVGDDIYCLLGIDDSLKHL